MIESNIASYNKSFPAKFVKAKGSYLYDDSGTKYLDFFTGAGTINYGHNNDEINTAIIKYMQNDGIMHSMDMDTEAKVNFINAVDKILLQPRKLDYKIQLCAPSGANSVEAALKLARKVKQRKGIIAFTGSFHGMTLDALSVTANKYYKNSFTSSNSNVQFLPYDNYINGLDSLEFLRKVLDDDVSGYEIPAAIILESIQADGGVNIASNSFLKGVRDICDEYDILMIIDDIQVGNGRTGDFFSFERASITPDIVTLSKALGGGMPLSILLFKSELDIWKTGEHTGTFRGNNLSFIAAETAIIRYWSNLEFSKEIKIKSKVIKSFLSSLDENIRGYGMIYGIDMNSKRALNIREGCYKNKLILELVGSNDQVIKLLPPLTINLEDLENGLGILKSELQKNR
jgi:diaminobutyrate-2-oxoglutarate transaminase